MPSSFGTCGITPLWAMVVRVSSAFSNARFTQRSRIVLVPRRQLLAGDVLDRRVRSAVDAGIDVRAARARCVRTTRDRRVMAELITASLRLAHGLLADRPRVSPLQREVLPQQHAQLVGRVVQLRARDVAVDAQQVESGIACQLHVAAHLRRWSPRRAPCRVGARLAPFTKIRSPLTENTQSCIATSRRPVRTLRVSLTTPSTKTSTSTSVSSCSPSVHGHHNRGVVDVEVPVHLVEASGE